MPKAYRQLKKQRYNQHIDPKSGLFLPEQMSGDEPKDPYVIPHRQKADIWSRFLTTNIARSDGRQLDVSLTDKERDEATSLIISNTNEMFIEYMQTWWPGELEVQEEEQGVPPPTKTIKEN